MFVDIASMHAWPILFSLLSLSRGSSTSEGDKNTEDSVSSGSVPGISASYTVSKLFPGRSDIACVAEDSRDVCHIHLMPPHSRNPLFRNKRGWLYEIKWWTAKGETARGAECHTVAAPLYPVAFPLMSRRAHLVPEYLSYTISAGEELRARLRGAKPRGEVWWQREPIQAGGWRQTTFTTYGELVIPAALLSGSGFYSFVDESNVNDTTILGTLSLVVRECPAHRYGDDCHGWCPDCMHGGVCHPQTGQCVCREGTMGQRCETRCKRGMGGRHCSILSLNLPGRQLCQPSPIPCRCLPGYTGARCNIPCTAEKWGSNCEQDCTHHCIGDCDSETGTCGGEGPSQCAGGDAGLPRLRQAPEVTEIAEDQATVVFSEWQEGYDDGNATIWDSLTYVVRLTDITANKSSVDSIATGSRHTLKALSPFTEYRVMVMVMVIRLNLTCMADGTGRERVHSVSFTSTCPKEIAAPVIVQTEKTSDTSVFVKWKPVQRPPGCAVQYLLSVIPEASNGTPTPWDTQNITLKETHMLVEELKANVAYTIQVLAKSTTSSSSVSPSSSTRVMIHQRSVGRAKTAVVVVAMLVLVLLVVVVVVVVLSRRRDRRPHSSVSDSRPRETVSASPPPPPLITTAAAAAATATAAATTTEAGSYKVAEVDEEKDEGGGGGAAAATTVDVVVATEAAAVEEGEEEDDVLRRVLLNEGQ